MFGSAGRLDGKVVVITGAARGQGEAEARRFVVEGAQVLLADVLDGQGQAVAAELGAAARYVDLDVTSPKDWAHAVSTVRAAHGRLDVLVNNAGIGIPPHDAGRDSDAEHRQTLDVNLGGVWLGMRHVRRS